MTLALAYSAGTVSRSSRIPMDASSNPRHNRLLAALPHDQWHRWLPHLEHVEMPLGNVLYEAGHTLTHVYFPTTAIVSLWYVMHDGASAEIAIVGNEGVVGVSLFMGGESTPSRALVQCAGGAFRLKAALMKEEFYQGGSGAPLTAALHPGADHADGADGRLQ